MTKSEIRDAQGSATKNMPLGSIRAVKTEDIVQVISSSGTTGRRVCHGITRNDMRPGMRNARFRSGEIDTHFIGEETGLLDDIRQDLEREGSLGVKLSQSGLSKAPVAAIAATAAVAQIMNSAGGRT